MKNKLENFSAKEKPPLHRFNEILRKTNDAFHKAEDLLTHFLHVLEHVKNVGINKILNAVSKVMRIADKIYSALKKTIKMPYRVKIKIKVPFRVKVKKWYNPFKWKWTFKWKKKFKWKIQWKTKYLKFTVYQILQQINARVRYLNKFFINKVNKILNPLLRKFKFPMPDLKGLKTLDIMVRWFNLQADKIRNAVASAINNIEKVIDKCRTIFDAFKKLKINCT